MAAPAQILDSKAHLKAVQKRIFGIKSLAAMPEVAWRLMRALSDENTTMANLAKLIESDQALTFKVLSLVNSSFYGFATKINTVERAAMMVGFQELQALALGAGLSEAFDLRKAPEGFDGEALWLHCLAVSWLAQKLAEAISHPVPSEAMIAGLLHDMGKLVLATHLSDLYAEVLQMERSGTPYHEAEERLLLHHEVIGYWLAQRWDLPEIHVEAIRYHHAPKPNLPYHVTTYLIFLANRMAKVLGLGLVQESKDICPVHYSKVINLTERDLTLALEQARQDLPPFLEKMRGMLAGGEDR